MKLSIKIVFVLNLASKHCSVFPKYVKVYLLFKLRPFLICVNFTSQIYKRIYLIQYIIYYNFFSVELI